MLQTIKKTEFKTPIDFRIVYANLQNKLNFDPRMDYRQYNLFYKKKNNQPYKVRLR
jgi:hypothetical protein